MLLHMPSRVVLSTPQAVLSQHPSFRLLPGMLLVPRNCLDAKPQAESWVQCGGQYQHLSKEGHEAGLAEADIKMQARQSPG